MPQTLHSAKPLLLANPPHLRCSYRHLHSSAPPPFPRLFHSTFSLCHFDPASTPHHPPPRVQERWESVFKSASPDAKHLLKALLALHPKERITAEDALKHPYVAQFHMPNVERTAAHHVHVPIDDCEKKSTAAYRNMLYEEVTRMKRQSDSQASAYRGGSSQR